jgi:drug/metabolite transporter (DMT)-like permease
MARDSPACRTSDGLSRPTAHDPVGATLARYVERALVMTAAVAIASTVLLLAGAAAANPVVTPPGLAPALPAPPPSPPRKGDEVSESTALAIAVGGTAASYGLVLLGAGPARGDAGQTLIVIGVAGTLIAPSAGRWYARSAGWRGLGLRLAGAAAVALAGAAAISECGLFNSDPCTPVAGLVLGIAGLGLWVGGTIDDIVMAPRDARRHNERLQQVTLVPLVRRDDHGLGLAVAARF